MLSSDNIFNSEDDQKKNLNFETPNLRIILNHLLIKAITPSPYILQTVWVEDLRVHPELAAYPCPAADLFHLAHKLVALFNTNKR